MSYIYSFIIVGLITGILFLVYSSIVEADRIQDLMNDRSDR